MRMTPGKELVGRDSAAPRLRRRFGRIAKQRSGRYQAGYVAPDGTLRLAEQTFPHRAGAEKWLILIEADLLRGEWADPEREVGTVSEWAEK
ncbi:MAG: hypothetical protein ACYCV7_14140 [Acidimicrobiales bacterium]